MVMNLLVQRGGKINQGFICACTAALEAMLLGADHATTDIVA